MLHFPRWKLTAVILVCALGVLAALPNFLPASVRGSIPAPLPSQAVSLGLDLQGGAHLLLEVDGEGLYRERLLNALDDVREAFLRPEDGGTRITHRRSIDESAGIINVRINDPGDAERAEKALRRLAQPQGLSILGGTEPAHFTVTRRDDSHFALSLTDDYKRQLLRQAVTQSVEVVRRRIDELGTKETTVAPQGDNRVLVQVPGIADTSRLKALIGQTAKLSFQMVDDTIRVSDPQTLLDEATRRRLEPDDGSTRFLPSKDGYTPYEAVRTKIDVSGESLKAATQGFDALTGEPVVNIRFDTTGARKFGEITGANVGKRFAIVLDDVVLSAPRINEPIPSGAAQISGSFTVESANNLAILLRSGSLPAKLAVLEERTVGPEMGADSIAAGKVATIIGGSLVVVFMVVAYGLFGVFAVIGLVFNLALIIGILSALQATLTLPGIAGIVLTMGMAVDANVLINERIREELRAGKTALNALEAGYSRAIATILDANITTLLAGLVMFQLGAGPVRGFAVTLSIGILTSMFTAVVLTQLMVSIWYRLKRPKTIPI